MPKGVILSHKNMVAGGEYTTLAHELTPEDRALCSLPLYHINGEVVTSVTPLVSGSSVVIPRKVQYQQFLGIDIRVRLHLVQRGAHHDILSVQCHGP